jgi:hypothetical protein
LTAHQGIPSNGDQTSYTNGLLEQTSQPFDCDDWKEISLLIYKNLNHAIPLQGETNQPSLVVL